MNKYSPFLGVCMCVRAHIFCIFDWWENVSRPKAQTRSLNSSIVCIIPINSISCYECLHFKSCCESSDILANTKHRKSFIYLDGLSLEWKRYDTLKPQINHRSQTNSSTNVSKIWLLLLNLMWMHPFHSTSIFALPCYTIFRHAKHMIIQLYFIKKIKIKKNSPPSIFCSIF